MRQSKIIMKITIKHNKMNPVMFFIFLFIFLSCNGQVHNEITFVCGGSTIKIEIPEIKKKDEYVFVEGKSEILITKDDVIIEFYCAGNYGSHISDQDRYVELFKYENSSRGIDKKTNHYWREDGNLIYSNCKEKDTAYYNRIFDNKIVR